ncbi:hypothetical protein [uncultured Tessaracoccus sp.]|uniref:hypothetical protein n=1 Tax=uncultured Tessaracoccus sp. TaxID=905023 RepID=UPI0025FC5625|nr:hypothetical protein [uncultured Tessaracoccus sp.]
MSEQKFRDAYEAIADVVRRSAQLPDHRERPAEPLEVISTSPQHEVTVCVEDARVRSIRIDDFWFEGASSDEVADAVRDVVNTAFEEWNRTFLEALRTHTPDMRELSVAMDAANAKLDDAWVSTLAEAKVPGA